MLFIAERRRRMSIEEGLYYRHLACEASGDNGLHQETTIAYVVDPERIEPEADSGQDCRRLIHRSRLRHMYAHRLKKSCAAYRDAVNRIGADGRQMPCYGYYQQAGRVRQSSIFWSANALAALE